MSTIDGDTGLGGRVGIYDLSIDPGAVTTRAAALRPDGLAEVMQLGALHAGMPSTALLGQDGNLVFGEAAHRRAATEPPDASVTGALHRVGDSTPIQLRQTAWPAERLVARFVRDVIAKAHDREGDSPRRVVLCVPAFWSPERRRLLETALDESGMAGVQLVSVTHAVAVAYAAQGAVSTGQTVAVYDLGGASYNVGLLRLGSQGFQVVTAPFGGTRAGGNAFDDLLLEHVKGATPGPSTSPPSMRQLRTDCLAAKELLSTETAVSVPVGSASGSHTVVVTRAELEHLIEPLVRATVNDLSRVIAAAPPGQPVEAVLLTGGSSRVPLVRRLVEAIGLPVVSELDPAFSAVLGGALMAPTGPPFSLAAARSTASDHGDPRPHHAPTPTSASTPTPTSDSPLAAEAASTPASRAAALTATLAATGPLPPAGGAPAGAKKRGIALIGGAVVLVAALVGVIVAVTRPDAKTAPSTSSPGTISSATTGAISPTSAVTTPPVVGVASPEGMVNVPAATYPIGSPNPDVLSETLRRQVAVSSFFIDAHEVTNADFKAFVDATNAAAPLAGWTAGRPPETTLDHPVRGVNFDWAAAYCTSLGKRLPTETEWEVAAAGPEGLKFAWGNEAGAVQLPSTGTYGVGSIAANKSPLGVFDLTGSVWEWTSTPYDTNKVQEGQRVLRGGQNGYIRNNWTRLPVDPTGSNSVFAAGFRCAADATSVKQGTPPLKFGSYARPSDPVAPVTTTPAGYRVFDDFTDSASGWLERSTPDWRFGYHPNRFFHLETKRGGQRVIALSPANTPSGPVAIVVEAEVELNLTKPEGTYEWGLVARAERAPDGPASEPTSYVAFVVNPRAQQWTAYLSKPGEPRIILQSAAFNFTEDVPVRLEIRDLGERLEFHINDRLVAETTAESLNLMRGTGAGFVLSSDDASTIAHLHYSSFGIKSL